MVALLGSKEGLAHLPLAVTDPGDAVLVPDPGYPVYTQGAVLAGVTPIAFPLTADRAFLPDPAGDRRPRDRPRASAVAELPEQPHGRRGRGGAAAAAR